VCHGDSGGPLLVSSAQGYFEIGVASYSSGPTCGTAEDYFARVSTLQPWIASQVEGSPPPAPYVPPLVPPTSVAVRLVRDGAVISFAPSSPDPATLLEGYTIALHTEDGRTVASQSVDSGTLSDSFTDLAPGSYQATVTADYSSGSSVATTSAPVTLAMPVNLKPPTIVGDAVPGGLLSCGRGRWRWPGTAMLTARWLRAGRYVTPPRRLPTSNRYVVHAADAGKRLTCRVTLTTATGATATAASRPVVVRPD
jgi:hypothetical protein